MKNKIDIKNVWAAKSRRIGLACEIMNRASAFIGWVDDHLPECVSDMLFHAYWRVDDWASALFQKAYEGSEEEIRDAWEFADEDWLTPFQRMVADERILPLPHNW